MECGAAEVSAHNHLNRIALAADAHRYHRVGRCLLPVGDDVGGRIEELRSNLIEDLPFEGDTLGQNHIECRDTVGSDHHETVIADEIHITYFAVVHPCLIGEREISSS